MLKRLTAAALAGLAVALAATAQETDDVQARLAVIAKVGREGSGNAEAASAWKGLVEAGTPALLPILGALDEDRPTAANWLRPAFDAVAEKALAAKDLPKSDLEKFVTDTKNRPAARRLAYEWLVKADKDAPERLLPKMLRDPSAELRRDSVARVIDTAERLAPYDSALGKRTFRLALEGACDPDQVEAIAKGLVKLGDKIDKAKHLGFVTQWHLVGPFDHHKNAGWDVAYPPEKEVNLNKDVPGKGGEVVGWQPFASDHDMGMVNLAKALGPFKGAVAYAYAVVESPEERAVEIRAGCIVAMKVFLNGQQVFAREEYHHGMNVDQYAARVTLRKGTNHILVKVCQNEQKEPWAQAWQFQLRLCDRVGAAVPFTQKAAIKGGD